MRDTLRVALLGLALICTVGPAWAGRGDDSNRKSKNGRLETSVDGVAVTIEYGRPQVRGREIWGALVPWGEVWRTGADEATTFEVEAAVEIGGKSLPPGRYSLFTIPGESEWAVVFNKVADQWGAFDYDSSQDALRIKVRPQEAVHVEELTFHRDGSAIVLRWETVAVPLEVVAAP